MRPMILAVVLLWAAPLVAGELHGRVACKGLRDSGDAVVYLTEDLPASPSRAAHVQITQRNLLFEPHVLTVPVGTTVDFVNLDTVLHNVFSPDACAGRFNLGSWPKGETRSYTFKKECVATILCNVHPEMEAYIVAVPNSYFGVTHPDGSYKIADVPDGSHAVKVWHPKLRAMEKTVAVNGPTELDFEVRP